MSIARSTRGDMVDFELLAIKAQLATTPIPTHVEERKRAIDAKDGVKTDQLSNLDFMQVAVAGAQAAEPEKDSPRTKTKTATQLYRK